ncbi:MAG: UDP-N-acetylmuramoyl-L-alanyl-D-glutamate--2,6-diaminopimelate ligase [Ruminococcaceae bacterium]|nr:UDP-N-acetylmuramoyl-L-alanyl-D-glutamate--2,6-diaminopimelate ligase [Oscillospiraceae bacterium]
MKLYELLKDTGISAGLIKEDTEIVSITCDSRRVEPGCLFVCIVGTAVDGHRFARQAQEAGAAAVVVQRDMGLHTQILVENSRMVWAQLCANWFGHPAARLKMIGVTGTNGKTTTTTLIKSMLEHEGHKVGLIGTIHNLIGDRVLPTQHTTPDPYDLQSLLALMVVEGCDYCVMEVSSHALDQRRVAGCEYEVGVFTNLTQDHLDYHGTMEHYMLAKKELFSLSRLGISNKDDAWNEAMTADIPCPVTTYSAKGDSADYQARNVRYRADGVDFELVSGDRIGQVKMQIPGEFSVYNGLCAASVCLQLGMDFDRVVEALSAAAGVKGRAEVVPTGRDFTVVIDYAHTPDGLDNICRTLKACCAGRLVTLFGCGGDRDKTKRPLMGAVAASLSDYLVVTSDNPRTEDPAAIIEDILPGVRDAGTPYTVVENRVEAIHWAIRNARPGDTILLAGKGHETYQILKEETIHLDEREVVAEALAQ